jgi:hypothetical protein
MLEWCLILVLVIFGLFIFTRWREGFAPMPFPSDESSTLSGEPLRYLEIYEDQDQYQRLPTIWPVVDTSTTAKFSALREAITKEKERYEKGESRPFLPRPWSVWNLA